MRACAYRTAVGILALNDDPSETDHDAIASSVAVGIVADIYAVTPDKLARDIRRVRLSPGHQRDDERQRGGGKDAPST